MPNSIVLACSCLSCSVVIESMFVVCFPVLPSSVLSGLFSEVMLCVRLHLRQPSIPGKGVHISLLYNSQLACLDIGYIVCLILPPHIHASIITQTAMSPHPSQPLFGHVPCLLNHCLVCMLGIAAILIFTCYSLDWAITLLYYCG